MATGKIATLSFRIEPDLKEALRAAAEREHRSIANMVEVLIREYCGREGIAIAEQSSVTRIKQAGKTNKTKSPQTKQIK